MGRHPASKFRDRAQAGALLSDALAARGVGSDAVVLGLLRGGVPVAAAAAASLDAELGVLAVRKLGVPDHRELAFGAVASYLSHAGRYLVPSVYRHALDTFPAAALEEAEINADTELEYLAARFAGFAPEIAGRIVVLCDDGLATGATMHAALEVATACGAAQLIVAVPVAPRDLAGSMPGADTLVVLRSPRDFAAVGAHYEDFSQVDEDTVGRLLRDAPAAHH
ncbi:phosphoribosyl transferase [Paeniglutamicibacter gangotriensis]|uniref:Phosphoribosyl transferase n=1 Tax=Paeniglutamicibacter gangotriensis TaxID=254787 RepID=A0A5B0EIZ6_9MICC|nr:phosphoribosyltransferase family protein [Paeniglutamicibacter gangotriensis]KAA0978666.1 phosphoribosyl transferase [Paeniglutamicibacter gangotriensis]